MIEYIPYINNIIKIFLLAWIITRFQPFQIYIVGSLEGINKGLFQKKPLLYNIIGSILKPLSCMKCAALWLGIILTGNLFISIASSIICHHYDKIDSTQKIKLFE